MATIEYVTTNAAPVPAGHYSQATKWAGLIFVSGQLPIRSDGTHTVDQPFEAQARQALVNVLGPLSEAGCGPEHVLRMTVYIVGIENWPAFDSLYAEALGSAKPARSVVPVPELHHGYLIEIEAIAARGG